MNDVDRHAAANALVEWFHSQDIMPAEAAMVMSTVMAEQLVIKTRNMDELLHATKITRSLLMLDIVEWLRK